MLLEELSEIYLAQSRPDGELNGELQGELRSTNPDVTEMLKRIHVDIKENATGKVKVRYMIYPTEFSMFLVRLDEYINGIGTGTVDVDVEAEAVTEVLKNQEDVNELQDNLNDNINHLNHGVRFNPSWIKKLPYQMFKGNFRDIHGFIDYANQELEYRQAKKMLKIAAEEFKSMPQLAKEAIDSLEGIEIRRRVKARKAKVNFFNLLGIIDNSELETINDIIDDKC